MSVSSVGKRVPTSSIGEKCAPMKFQKVLQTSRLVSRKIPYSYYEPSE